MSQGVHTCSEFCPCQTGGRPAPDFVPGGEGPAVLVQAAWERAADREREWRDTANQTQKALDASYAENEALRASLKWALGWIYTCTEVPLPDEEPEDNASYLAALELVTVPE